MKTIGSAAETIDLPEGTPMGGYADRVGTSIGVSDPLQATVVLVDDGGRQVALVSLDLVAVTAGLADAVKSAVASATGGRSDDVVVAATHTHCGPDVGARPGGGHPPEAVVAAVIRAVARAADTAKRRRGGIRAVRFGCASVTDVGGVRERAHRGAGPVPLALVSIEHGITDRTVLMCLACHPTVLGADHLKLSSDLAGAARRTLATQLRGEQTEGSVTVMSLTGAAGDISTRAARREQTPSECRRLGARVARQARMVLRASSLVDTESSRVRVFRDRLRLPTRTRLHAPPRTSNGSDDVHRDRAATTSTQGRDIGLQMLRQVGANLELELAVVQLGGLRLATIPGELFVSLGDQIQASLDTPVMLVGYSEGYVGYLPDLPAWRDVPSSYEVQVSVLEPGAGEEVVARSVQLLQQSSNSEEGRS